MSMLKSKIIGTLICIMLVATCGTVAKTIEERDVKQIQDEKVTPEIGAHSYDDIPTWYIGDRWNYSVKGIDISYQKENFSLALQAEIEKLPFEVIEVTNDSYKVNFSAIIKGHGALSIDFGNGSILEIKVNLNKSEIVGYLIYNKSDLAIQRIVVNFSKLLLSKQILNYAVMNITGDLDVPYPEYLHFPLDQNNTGTIWNCSETNMTLTGLVQSLRLQILYRLYNHELVKDIINRIISHLPPPLRIKMLMLIKLLNLTQPGGIIAIEDLLNEINGQNTITIAETSIWQNEMAWVTVPASPQPLYCYNISIMNGKVNIYYNGTVGNFVKVTGHYVTAELLSWQRAS